MAKTKFNAFDVIQKAYDAELRRYAERQHPASDVYIINPVFNNSEYWATMEETPQQASTTTYLRGVAPQCTTKRIPDPPQDPGDYDIDAD